MADEFSKKSSAQFKKTIVKEAVLKPAQTADRLQNGPVTMVVGV